MQEQNFRIVSYLCFLVIQVTAYCIVFLELPGQNERNVSTSYFAWSLIRRMVVGKAKEKEPKSQRPPGAKKLKYKAQFALIPPYPSHPPRKWPHTDSQLHTIHCLTYCLSSSVQPPPCELSQNGHHSIWQGEETILKRCFMTKQAQPTWT